jgi:hypothetical protein
MAAIHVLSGAETGGSFQVVFHFPVPDTNNSVGVNYRAALVASGKGGSTRLTEGTGPGEITTAEKAQIESGAVYEHSRTIQQSGGDLSTPNLLAEVRSFYSRDKGDLTARIAVALQYFGYTAAEA